MKNRYVLSSVVAACMCAGMTARAALIAYEGFDGNATGFSSTFSSPETLSLNYNDGTNDLQTVAGSSDTSNRFTQTATLSTALTSGTHDTVWFSFLVDENISNTGNDDFRFDVYDSGSNTGFSIQSHFNGPNANLSLISGPGSWNTHQDLSVSANQLNFFVVEVNMDTGLINAYVNPSLTTGPGPAAGTFTSTVATANGLDTIGIVFAAANDFAFDEIRVGETFADVAVIPEPSSLFLVGIASLTVLRLIPRRN